MGMIMIFTIAGASVVLTALSMSAIVTNGVSVMSRINAITIAATVTDVSKGGIGFLILSQLIFVPVNQRI